jgi:hypothetical protein
MEMDRPSIMFAHILDAITVDNDSSLGDNLPVLACQTCGTSLCDIEEGDTMRVLLNTALAHKCEG